MQRCSIAKTTPLNVTGYTCPLGSRRTNSALSLLRARVVAGLLRAVGFTVADRDIQGKGQENPVTNDPDKFAMNRRVEISRN
jgi:outer membrane protein OmpA-like peptidoglycan-associated protein